MNNMTVQETLDKKIHRTIQEYCDIKKHPIRLEQALLAFDFLTKSASQSEIKAHKGEYLFFFYRLVASLKEVEPQQKRTSMKSDAEQHTPKIVELMDWFLAQKGRDDGVYKPRLRKVFQTIRNKNLPIPTKKIKEWEGNLEPKHRVTLKNWKIENPETVYHCTFYGRAHKHRPVDKD